ncbi:hypothetical protein [Actinocorallia libanotica]|uniref:hypothetical protein n=1 Tax=Actinocorallia libanotica TaxID=46162 RepID=UPI0031D40224
MIAEEDLPEWLRRAVARGDSRDTLTQGRALACLAAAVLPADPVRGRALLDRGRDLSLADRSFPIRDLVLAELAHAAAEGGDRAKARELVLASPDEGRRTAEFLKLMRSTAPDGVPPLADEAETLLWRLPADDRAALPAAELATLLAPHDPRRSRALVDYAEGILPSVVDPDRAARVLAELARASTALGDTAQAFARIDRSAAINVGHPDDLALLLTELAETAVAAGDRDLAVLLLEEARTLLADAPDPYMRFLCSLEVARSARIAGDDRTAREALREAELTAPAVEDPYQQALAWTELARLAPSEDFVPRALALLPSIGFPGFEIEVLRRLPAPVHDHLSRALSSGPWPVCLIAALLAFPDPAPEVLLRIADDLLTTAL